MRAQESILEGILHDVDLEGTKVRVINPLKKGFLNLSWGKRSLLQTFEKIEERIRQRADPFYEDVVEFREVGGFCLIEQEKEKYIWKSIFETEGGKARKVVFPGRGLDIRWSCDFPKLTDLGVNWNSVVYFIRYHSHPYLSSPNPKDISAALENFFSLPEDVKCYQAIYSKIWTPNFLWLEHYK